MKAKEYFIYNGRPSTDWGCYVANANQFDRPSRDVESVNIPGMNGSLTIDNGRYNNLTLTYSMYARDGIQDKIAGIINHLTQNHGYHRLEDTYRPNEFYLARYVSDFSVAQSDRNNAGFAIVFDRKPQRFLKDGEIPLPDITAATTIINDTAQIAKPLIRAYGTGSFTINGTTMTISTADGYTDIDCEIMEAYKGSTNCNGNISGDFPELVPGSNTITLTGLTSIVITPRWWIL